MNEGRKEGRNERRVRVLFILDCVRGDETRKEEE